MLAPARGLHHVGHLLPAPGLPSIPHPTSCISRPLPCPCSQFNLAFAWALALACGFHHVGHLLHALGMHQYAHTGFMSHLGAAWVSGVLGAAALLGPGRQLLVEGALALARWVGGWVEELFFG